MKTFKRFLASLMVAVMVLTAAPLNGFVGLELKLDWLDFSTQASAAGSCGENVTWSYDVDTKVLTISGTGPMYDYSSTSPSPWSNYYGSSIAEVIIEDGVTSIGSAAFYYDSISSISIPNSVTRIGGAAFEKCSNLESVVIPDSVETMGTYVFNACTGLESVVIGNNVVAIGLYSFSGCYQLSSVTIGEKVKSIGERAFSACFMLKDIVLPDGLTDIGPYAFDNCGALTEIIIPDGVTVISGYAFDRCDSLTSIVIPDGVTTIGKYAFYDCTELNYVTLYNSVTYIGKYAFYGCGIDTTFFHGTSSEFYSIENSMGNSPLSRNIVYIVDGREVLAAGTCGDDITWILYKDGELVISGTGAMYDYHYDNEAPWYGYRSSIKKITIGDGVTSIGSYMFADCEALTDVTIPDSVESIAMYAFYNCKSLTDVVIPDSVETLGIYAFASNTSLENVVLSNSIKSIESYTFWNCTGLKSIIIPDNVTNIGSDAFRVCTNLESIILPVGINDMGYRSFIDTLNLKDIYYKGNKHQWNIKAKAGILADTGIVSSNVTIHFMEEDSLDDHTFVLKTTISATCTENGQQKYTCSCGEQYTEELPATGHNYNSVVVIPTCQTGGYTVHTCTVCGDSYTDSETKATGHQYNSVVVSPTCTENGYTIRTCTGCGDSYTDSETEKTGHKYNSVVVEPTCTDGGYTIHTCTVCSESYKDAEKEAIGHDYRQTIVPPVGLEEGYISNVCRRCNDSYKTDITPTTAFTGVCGDNLIWTLYLLTGELVISGTGDMYDYTGNDAPWDTYDNKNLIQKITIENGVTSIGSWAFSFFRSPANVTIPSSVTNIGDFAFYYWETLESITIPGSVTNIDSHAFAYCSGLKSVTIESGAQNIGDYAFAYCTGLVSVIIENGVKRIGSIAFKGCTGITDIIIPDSVISIGFAAFSKCTGLTSVTIENGVESIDADAFNGCTGLKDVTIPDSITSIYSGTFSGCTNLASVTIPDSITSIYSGAFSGCTNLASVTIPTSVTYIGDETFADCTALKDVYFKGNPHQWKCLINKYPDSLDIENITVHYGDSDSFDDHTFKLKSTIKETCTEKGQKEYSCACGEQYTEEISAKGHSYSSTVVAPTCTDGGYTVHTCTDCGDSYTDTDTEIIEHQYNSVVVKPNCTLGGYTIHTCTACGDSYTDSETEPSGHDYYQTVVVPTCKDSGYTINTCHHCGDEYISDRLPAAGHQYTSVVISPTCLNEGYTLGACNVCGASSISDKKPALGHEYIEQVTPPTCEAEGYTTFTCTRGDHIYIDNRVAASGHDYEQTVFAPTCIQDGCTFNICNDCGRLHKSDVVAATGHSFGSWRTVISPAENKEGLEERYCKYCGYTEERTLPMTQRTAYTATFVADGKKVATIEFLKGTTSIEEPPVPHKDRYNGEWEDYTLGNADIVINAKYQPVALNNLSGISNNKTASYDASTGIASVTLTASSDAKTVITQSKERVPLDIVLVVDQSGSMNSNLGGRYSKKDSLIDSTYEFVDMVYEDALTNGIDHKIAIVGFGMGSKSSGSEYPAFLNTEILTTGRRPLGVQYATKEDYKNALMSVNQNGTLNGGITTAINSIDANGATAADYGLSMASSIFANNPIEAGENRQRIVIFISDGEPTYSSGFEVDVANAAIQQAHQLKNTHNATIYSVGVMTDAEAKSEKLNAFLARVSSDYMDARNIFGNADRVSETFSINVDDTDNLSAMFGDIVTENVTQTTDFDSVTVIDTVSRYFTLTSQQEKALRYSLISEYGVKNSDIEIIRNEDGTTSIKISNIKTKPIETDGKVKYTVTINYEVSANENAATAGTYPICTDDSGIIIDGNDCYERTFPVPTAEITENRNTVVFKVNGEVYAIKSVTPGSKVTVPETDFIGEYEFSGWDVPKGFVSDETLSEFDSVLIRPEYVIIWNTESGTEKVTYSPGDIIDEPEVSTNANGEAFRRWNGTVPVQMPAESLEFTAVYGDHEHQYYTETTKEMTCLEDGEVKHICSVCNDSYTETVKTPGEHSWKAIAKPGNKDNSSSAYFECERCGICADKQLNYIITENEPNERGHFESLTHEFNYVDEEGNLYQPDGNIEIVTTVSDYFEGADSVNVYRIDENGNKVKCNSEYDNGVLTFETNHFSTYVFEPYYSCQSTGEHGDENGDGYCDRCDSVLKEFIDFIIKEGIDAQIDSDNHILLGNDVLNYSVEEIAGLFEFGNIYVEGKENGRIGTGDVICLTNDSGEVCNRLTAVIFGDVNGDGWYDGMDAVLVSCLANGMLTKDDVSEAVYIAADCNHDGVIDQLDVDLLNQAGTLLANVDQSKTAEVLLETSSEYVEYISLIDQSFEIEDVETEDIPEADAEGTPEMDNDVESGDTTPEQDAKIDIFEMIINFIKSIFEMLFAYIPVPLK